MLFTPEFGWPTRRDWRGMLREFSEAALDLLYPPHCANCNLPLPVRIGSVICAKCAEEMRWIGADRCVRCGNLVGAGSGPVEACVACKQTPPRFVKAAACVVRYENGPARNLVLALKFGRRSHQAKMMGRLMARRIIETGLLEGLKNPILVPAPLTRIALFSRGFNQAGELAYWIARELNLRLEDRLLVKTRATLPQAQLSQKRRQTNLTGAFACRERALKKCRGADILFVDDVITTGCTISECARTLHAAGMGKIFAAAFARG